MIAEQLQAARAAHWRQNQNPILTLEDAQSWIERHPLSLFLPRRTQLPAPAPTFVEAVLGESSATPPAAAIEQARELLVRLIGSGHAVALNLLGALGEQPDFVAQTEILPFAVALRGERDWKQPPGKAGGQKVSPLVLDLWKLLETEGPLTAASAREKLGRELTEVAVMRALSELWQTLRVLPALQAAGQPAIWALTQHHQRAALIEGSSTSQVTAISLLVSMYLQSVFAATNEEIETFLSPLVSRSRTREAVRGLSATRQIHSLSMDAQTYYFLEGGLPEFAQEPQPARAEPARKRRPDLPAPPPSVPSRPERFKPTSARPPVSRWTPSANTAAAPVQPAAANRAAGGAIARGAQPGRTHGQRPPRAGKPRWQKKADAPGRPRPSFGARPTGDWKRKPAAAAGSAPPGARWRKFPQRADKSRDQRGKTGDRPPYGPPPAPQPSTGQPLKRPPRPQGHPQSREGCPPWKKPRWDRNRTTGAVRPQRGDAPQANSRGERSAYRKPYRREDGDDRRGKPGQGFSPPRRRSSAPLAGSPAARSNQEGRPARPDFSRPGPRGFAKPGPRASDSGKPRSYKPAGYRAGVRNAGPKKEGREKKDRSPGGSKPGEFGPRKSGSRESGLSKSGSSKSGPRGFGPRGFDSRSRPGRPKSSKFTRDPKSGFRDRNLGKKKPEA